MYVDNANEIDEIDKISTVNDEAKKRHFRRGIFTLIGGVSLQLFLGCFFLWGNISIYVLSYFHETSPNSSYNFIFAVDTILILGNWIGY